MIQEALGNKSPVFTDLVNGGFTARLLHGFETRLIGRYGTNDLHDLRPETLNVCWVNGICNGVRCVQFTNIFSQWAIDGVDFIPVRLFFMAPNRGLSCQFIIILPLPTILPCSEL